MSLDINLTNVESTTNKKTTLTDNSDTFYPTQKAVKTAVDAKFNTPTGTTAQYLRGDGTVATFPTIPDASDFVEKSDFTSHSILAKQSGASDPVAVSIGNNEILGRKSGGGSDIEGLSVSEVKSLLNYTASDVGAPSGSGSSTGTNTGDETQSTILSKLGFWQYNRVSESSAITNTTSESIIENITIPANTYLNGGILRLYNIKFRKVGTVAGTVLKIYIGPNANNLSGATQIALLNITPSTLTTEMLRTFTCFTNAIVGFNAGSSVVSDVTNNTLARTQTSVDWTITQNIIITTQTGVLSADSITLIGTSAKNF
jgi:hypothetical protein